MSPYLLIPEITMEEKTDAEELASDFVKSNDQDPLELDVKKEIYIKEESETMPLFDEIKQEPAIKDDYMEFESIGIDPPDIWNELWEDELIPTNTRGTLTSDLMQVQSYIKLKLVNISIIYVPTFICPLCMWVVQTILPLFGLVFFLHIIQKHHNIDPVYKSAETFALFFFQFFSSFFYDI